MQDDSSTRPDLPTSEPHTPAAIGDLAGTAGAAVPAEVNAIKVGGRTTKVRSDGVAYTVEKKMIAVHLSFAGKRKREQAEAKLGCKRTALYRWKKAYPEAASDAQVDPGYAHATVLQAVKSRSDEDNIAVFLRPEFAVPLSANRVSEGAQLVVRPDGLGPTAEFGADTMSPELLACLRLVDDGSGALTDEECNRLMLAVEEDVPAAADDLVSHSLTLGAKLAYTNLAKSTTGIWKGPQRKFTAFWRALARLRAETEADKEAASKLDVLATEQKLVTWLNCSILFKNPTMGYEAVRTHVKAINNLWEQQHLSGRNDHPASPGSGKLCGQYLKAVKRHQADLARLTNIDKFRNSLRDGYDESGFHDISRWFIAAAASAKNEFAAVRDRFAFLWQHAIMGRSEDLRERELSDLYSAELPHSKPHPSIVIVSTQLKSKANRDARPERGVAARHKDVELCAQGALAIYLFYRFHVLGEPAPDFGARDAWYRTKLLVENVSSDLSKGVTWDVQARLLRQAFADCRISSSHLTHAMRSGGAQFASAAGCTEDAIRKHGRWCGDRLMERYLTTVTLQPIRALSGFSIAGGDYWLPRTLHQPPPALSQQIFPWVEAKLEQVQQRVDNGGESDGAALQFLQMMKYLRVVLLQDSVVLKKLHPSFPLWSHPLFSSSDFQAFAQDLDGSIRSTASPFDISITQLVPSLGCALGDVRTQLGGLAEKVEELQQTSAQQHLNYHQHFSTLAANMAGITQLFVAAQQSEAKMAAARTAVAESLKALSVLSCQLNTTDHDDEEAVAARAAGASSPAVPSPPLLIQAAQDTAELSFSAGTGDADKTSAHAHHGSSPAHSPAHPPLPQQLPFSTSSSSRNSTALPQATAAATAAAAALGLSATYELPTVSTAAELWLEWSHGRSGRAALGGMDAAKDSRLRSSNKVRQKVYRWRKVVAFLSEVGPGREEIVANAIDDLMKKRKGGLRLLAEELAKTGGQDRWTRLLQDNSNDPTPQQS